MIEATGLGRRFGPFVAVEDVSLRVPDGKILALLEAATWRREEVMARQ